MHNPYVLYTVGHRPHAHPPHITNIRPAPTDGAYYLSAHIAQSILRTLCRVNKPNPIAPTPTPSPLPLCR